MAALAANRTSVPQIWIGQKHVGGCDDLKVMVHDPPVFVFPLLLLMAFGFGMVVGVTEVMVLSATSVFVLLRPHLRSLFFEF